MAHQHRQQNIWQHRKSNTQLATTQWRVIWLYELLIMALPSLQYRNNNYGGGYGGGGGYGQQTPSYNSNQNGYNGPAQGGYNDPYQNNRYDNRGGYDNRAPANGAPQYGDNRPYGSKK